MLSLILKLVFLGALIFFGAQYFGYDLSLQGLTQTAKNCTETCFAGQCSVDCADWREVVKPIEPE